MNISKMNLELHFSGIKNLQISKGKLKVIIIMFE